MFSNLEHRFCSVYEASRDGRKLGCNPWEEYTSLGKPQCSYFVSMTNLRVVIACFCPTYDLISVRSVIRAFAVYGGFLGSPRLSCACRRFTLMSIA